MSPYPAAWTVFSDKSDELSVKIYDAKFEAATHDLSPGRLIREGKQLKAATIDGFIVLKTMQFPGKKMMAVADILNGLQLSDDAHLY